MLEKLVETFKVETFLKKLRCPNKQCNGYMDHDGKTRTENGIHGGSTEYRHRCAACGVGIWSAVAFPSVTYVACDEKLEIKKGVEDAEPIQHPVAVGAGDSAAQQVEH